MHSALTSLSPAVLATLVAAVVGTGHYVTHRLFGDEVLFSKTAVGKAGIVVTGLTWLAIYLVAGGGTGVVG